MSSFRASSRRVFHTNFSSRRIPASIISSSPPTLSLNFGPRSRSIQTFAAKWTEWFPTVRRSAHLLETAQDAPEAERQRTLDRTLKSILDGTRNQMADFTARISGPTTALYVFGVTETQVAAAMLPIDQLGIVVGVFVIILCFVLVPLSIALRHGMDHALIGYNIGRSLLSAIPLYVISVLLVTFIK